MQDLAIAGTIRFDQDIAVDKGLQIGRVIDQNRTPFGIHQVHLAIAAFDPVRTDHCT